MMVEIFRQGDLIKTVWSAEELDLFLEEDVEGGDILREDNESTLEVMDALKSWHVNYEVVGNRFRIKG